YMVIFLIGMYIQSNWGCRSAANERIPPELMQVTVSDSGKQEQLTMLQLQLRRIYPCWQV
ncbi:hypothetical protein, partial [Yersinia aleksiciae]|uniref:hypothetical protein n=1 Tax=Yersinia aleksiciae TaxID=263819 RepID=UPI001C97763B